MPHNFKIYDGKTFALVWRNHVFNGVANFDDLEHTLTIRIDDMIAIRLDKNFEGEIVCGKKYNKNHMINIEP